jgi:hypothetical protein
MSTEPSALIFGSVYLLTDGNYWPFFNSHRLGASYTSTDQKCLADTLGDAEFVILCAVEQVGPRLRSCPSLPASCRAPCNKHTPADPPQGYRSSTMCKAHRRRPATYGRCKSTCRHWGSVVVGPCHRLAGPHGFSKQHPGLGIGVEPLALLNPMACMQKRSSGAKTSADSSLEEFRAQARCGHYK